MQGCRQHKGEGVEYPPPVVNPAHSTEIIKIFHFLNREKCARFNVQNKAPGNKVKRTPGSVYIDRLAGGSGS